MGVLEFSQDWRNMKQIRPKYYVGKDGTQVIDVLFNFGVGEDFCIANVIKYCLRARNKNGVEDLKKARTYLDLLIDHLEGETSTKPEQDEEIKVNIQPDEDFEYGVDEAFIAFSEQNAKATREIFGDE